MKWVWTGLILCVPLSLSPTQNDVISKLCTCAISLGIYLSLCKLIPVERSIDEDFVNSTPFHLQVIYLYLAMLALRPKYYFVWTLGEFHMMSRPRYVHQYSSKRILLGWILVFLCWNVTDGFAPITWKTLMFDHSRFYSGRCQYLERRRQIVDIKSRHHFLFNFW